MLPMYHTIQPFGTEWRIYTLMLYDIISSGNGLSPARHQPITWTHAAPLSNEPWEGITKQRFSSNEINLNMSVKWQTFSYGLTLQWRHNERDGVSNHRHLDCLLNCLFRHKWKKTLRLRVAGLCEGNSPVTGVFPEQRASNAENVSIWWRHHECGLRVRPGNVNMWAGFVRCQAIYWRGHIEIHSKHPNTLRPKDALGCQQMFGTIAWGLLAIVPSHYLNQCWLINPHLSRMIYVFIATQNKWNNQGKSFEMIPV